MPPHKIMSINARREYVRMMSLRYTHANKAERGRLLDEMQSITQMHRKSLVRLITGDLARHPRSSQRGRTYGTEMDDALRIISESYDYPCAERLSPGLVDMATRLARHGELTVTPHLLEALDQISTSTVGRILRRITQDQPHLPRPDSLGPALTHDIPMTVIPWNQTEPGHFETDLVHHCGSVTTGQYTHTLQLVDVATGWSERHAMLGRSHTRLEDAFGHIQPRLPFAIRELHPDNGGEFVRRVGA
jgi:hypothetical protein